MFVVAMFKQTLKFGAQAPHNYVGPDDGHRYQCDGKKTNLSVNEPKDYKQYKSAGELNIANQ